MSGVVCGYIVRDIVDDVRDRWSTMFVVDEPSRALRVADLAFATLCSRPGPAEMVEVTRSAEGVPSFHTVMQRGCRSSVDRSSVDRLSVGRSSVGRLSVGRSSVDRLLCSVGSRLSGIGLLRLQGRL